MSNEEPIEEVLEPVAEEAAIAPAYETKYYVDQAGNYLGGYAGPDEDSPYGTRTASSAPADYRDTWTGSQWVAHVEILPNVQGLAEAVWAEQIFRAINPRTDLPIVFDILSFEALIATELPKGLDGIARIKEGWQLVRSLYPEPIRNKLEELAAAYHVPIV